MPKKKPQDSGTNAQPIASGPEPMGFPALEKLLEQANPDLSGFNTRKEQLKQMVKKARQAGSKTAARQAELAYQRFFELFEELIKIRADLEKEQQEPAEKSKE